MSEWIVFAVAAMISWGVGNLFPKIATNYIDPKSVLIYQVVGGTIIGLTALLIFGFPEMNANGMAFGILTGITGVLGALFFLFAVSRSKASVIVTMTALYPLVTILLVFLVLKEPITLTQGAGIMIALASMILLSSESKQSTGERK